MPPNGSGPIADRNVVEALTARLDAVAGPQPQLDVDRLVHGIARTKGQAVVAVPVAMSVGGPCGLRLSSGSTEYVLFNPDEPADDRYAVMLHGLAHIVLGHVGWSPAQQGVLRRLVPDIGLGAALQAIGTPPLSERDERDASVVAALLEQRDRAHRAEILSTVLGGRVTAGERPAIGRRQGRGGVVCDVAHKPTRTPPAAN